VKLDICIPTLNRRDKLQICINSILRSAKSADIQLVIYFGMREELEYFKSIFSCIPNIQLIYLETYRVPNFWNNYLFTMTSDGLLYLNDDVQLFDNALEVILTEFPKHFPDYDGVMGICQANLDSTQALESAFGIIGRKYADRFPIRQVWAPCYDRFFCDRELWLYAKSINKFYFCEEARLNHYHPSLNHEWEDTTHNEVRKYLKQDKITFQKRQALGLLWGKSYQLK
jgi:glycosyltransferase involved in cell wall biosynthesis